MTLFPAFLRRIPCHQRRPLSDRPRPSPLSPDNTAALKEWVAAFKRERLSKAKAGCEVRFDRSGGKGGQNVNKVNTKATLKIDLSQASWIPRSLLPSLANSPYYAPISHSLLIAGSSYRTQSENLQDCFDKIQTHLLALAKPLTPATTSEQQKQSVSRMIQAHKNRVRVEKDRRSNIKKDRRKGGWE